METIAGGFDYEASQAYTGRAYLTKKFDFFQKTHMVYDKNYIFILLSQY
jgi:hypothetical protein